MTRLGMTALICLALAFSLFFCSPVLASETNPPTIDRSPTDTGDSWNVSVNGRYANGPALAVDVRSDTTYSGNGAVFEIVDFSNSVPPAPLGRVTLPSVIKGITVVGNYAYVADHEEGLQIIDISDPTTPVVVGAYLASGYSVEVDVVDDIAYLANGNNGIRLIDVSTPSTPTEISRYQISGTTTDVKAVGDYAYVAAGTNGIFIIDISNPASPTEVGSYDTSGNYYKIEVVGDYAFMAAYTYDLEVVDIENPAAPSKLTHLPVNGSAISICIDGDYAYVGSGGINVVDISNPELPFVVGSMAQPAQSIDVAVSGSRVYVAADNEGVVAYNVAAPATPSIVSTHETNDNAVGIAAVKGVTSSMPGPAISDYMYIAEGNDGIRVVDITDPSNPSSVGQYVIPAHRAEDVAVVGNLLYVPCSDGFRVINVGDPSSPTETGYYNTYGSMGVAVNGNYAYVAAKGNGLYVIDISNPSIPAEVGVYDTPGSAWDVVYNAGYAYVADYNSGLTIVDVSTPSAPSQAGAYADPSGVRCVAVTGDYAYVGTSNDGVYVIDVSAPATPVEIANIDLGSNTHDLFMNGNYLYVASAFSGLEVVYINDKFNSPLVGHFNTGHNGQDVFVIGQSVYVADFGDGAWMLEFEPPPTPTFISGFFCEPVDGGVELSWQILSDDVVEGFNIYRSAGSGGQIVNTEGLIAPDQDWFVDQSIQAGGTYEYRLAVLLDDGSEVLSQPQTVTVRGIELSLKPNYPNPFNPNTRISFVNPTNGQVNLAVYTADGKLVRTLVDGSVSEGFKTFEWDGKDEHGSPVSSGVYFCRLTTGNRTLTQKMTLVK